MTNGNRTLWHEGLYMLPQHFQQHDRWIEGQAVARLQLTRRFAYGFERISINGGELARGSVRIDRARGLLPDGTAFDWPDQDPAPMAFEVPADMRDERLFVCLARERAGVPSARMESPGSAAVRIIGEVINVQDSVAGAATAGAAPLHVGRLHLRLVRERDLGDGTRDEIVMGAVRVITIDRSRGSKAVVLDDGYVPPCLSVAHQGGLRHVLPEVIGLLEQRAEVIVRDMADVNATGFAEVQQLLMLQSLNRHLESLRHLHAVGPLHPEELYRNLVAIAGDFATFTPARRVVDPFPRYDHDDIGAVLRPVLDAIRRALSVVFELSAVQIPVAPQRNSPGAWVAAVQDVPLWQSARFYLALRLEAGQNAVRERVERGLAACGALSKGAAIVAAAPSEFKVPLQFALAKPAAIPTRAGFVYLAFDSTGPAWQETVRSGALLLFFAGDWSGLQVELWAHKG